MQGTGGDEGIEVFRTLVQDRHDLGSRARPFGRASAGIWRAIEAPGVVGTRSLRSAYAQLVVDILHAVRATGDLFRQLFLSQIPHHAFERRRTV